MKKICTFLALVLYSFATNAQAPLNPGMETWRTGVALCLLFPLSPTSVTAPQQWYSTDSLAISLGPLVFSGTGDTDYHKQTFKETVLVRSGTASAKIMTAMEGDLGFFPGTLSNAKAVVDMSSGTPTIDFTGGLAVTDMPTTVSAWVVYHPGIDPVTDTIGYDEGVLTISAIALIGTIDSTVGEGFVTITPSDTDTFAQVTATMTYTVSDYPIHTLRITFASSDPTATPLDSSTLYVDDVSFTSVPNPPPPTTKAHSLSSKDEVRVFPNPANGVVHITSPANSGYTCTLQSVSGQVVAKQALTGKDKIDISQLSAGTYMYTVSAPDGSSVQQGKLTVTN